MAAGAHGLTVHPRPDERHTRHSDLPVLRALIDDEFPAAEFNIEGYPSEDFLQLVENSQPDQVTLVPDDPAQATSDHGWDFAGGAAELTPIVRRLKKGGFRVSLFCDPDPAAMTAARDTGADRVEFYTGPYGACYDDPKRRPGSWKGSEKLPMQRLPPGSPSMPATTSPLPICRRWSAAFRRLQRSRSAMP